MSGYRQPPSIEFPVEIERIPEERKKLSDFARGLQAQLEITHTMLRMLREQCPHPKEKSRSGYNERDGSWFQCDHCGESR